MSFNFHKKMSELRRKIIQEHQAGKTNKQIRQDLFEFNVNRKFIYRVIKRFNETGELENRKSSGRSRTVRTPEKIKVIRERIRRNPTRSARKLAKETNTSRSTIQRILHEDLRLCPFKKRKVHGLTDAQKKKRYERSGTLLAWHENDEIIFSDEKSFCWKNPSIRNNIEYGLYRFTTFLPTRYRWKDSKMLHR